jgi:hypothetical protein
MPDAKVEGACGLQTRGGTHFEDIALRPTAAVNSSSSRLFYLITEVCALKCPSAVIQVE